MPGIESIVSITLKSLLITGLVYFMWHRFVVLNDSVRANNMAVLSFLLSFVVYGGIYFNERGNATQHVDEFQTAAVENLQSLQFLNENINAFKEELTIIDDTLKSVQQETKTLYEKMARKQISDKESQKRRKILLNNINVLENQFYASYAKYISINSDFNRIVFSNDTSSNLNLLYINKINNLTQSYIYNSSDPSEKICKSLSNIQQNEGNLHSELTEDAERMHVIANQIANLRRELIGDVNILYISPDISN